MGIVASRIAHTKHLKEPKPLVEAILAHREFTRLPDIFEDGIRLCVVREYTTTQYAAEKHNFEIEEDIYVPENTSMLVLFLETGEYFLEWVTRAPDGKNVRVGSLGCYDASNALIKATERFWSSGGSYYEIVFKLGDEL
jgi:hypothetical protein